MHTHLPRVCHNHLAPRSLPQTAHPRRVRLCLWRQAAPPATRPDSPLRPQQLHHQRLLHRHGAHQPPGLRLL